MNESICRVVRAGAAATGCTSSSLVLNTDCRSMTPGLLLATGTGAAGGANEPNRDVIGGNMDGGMGGGNMPGPGMGGRINPSGPAFVGGGSGRLLPGVGPLPNRGFMLYGSPTLLFPPLLPLVREEDEGGAFDPLS